MKTECASSILSSQAILEKSNVFRIWINWI